MLVGVVSDDPALLLEVPDDLGVGVEHVQPGPRTDLVGEPPQAVHRDHLPDGDAGRLAGRLVVLAEAGRHVGVTVHDHVIVGDVDELVVVDPAAGVSLLDFLRDQPIRRVLTPVGLEVVHRVADEPAPIEDHILGPRRHVRLAPHYSKPCVVSQGVKIARGGHFTQADKLHTPDELLLLHLKFCDFDNYARVMDHRNAVTEAVGVGVRDASIGRHWFAEARGEDRAVFEGFAELEMQEGFDLGWVRKRMHRTWKARGETGYWQFDRPDHALQYRLPERFTGLI